MKRLLGKKGSDTSMFPIIAAIVLVGLIVVISIFGIQRVFGIFRGSTEGRLGTSNANEIISACKLACDNSAQGDYCSNPRTLNFGDERIIKDGAGKFIDKDGKILTASKAQKQITGTCEQLSSYTLGEGTTKITIETCSPNLCGAVSS